MCLKSNEVKKILQFCVPEAYNGFTENKTSRKRRFQKQFTINYSSMMPKTAVQKRPIPVHAD